MAESKGASAPFGLTKAPFSPQTDGELFVAGNAQKRALAHLRYGQRQGEGIVLITGDEGVGKSAVLSHFIKAFETAPARIVLLSAKDLGARGVEPTLLAALRPDLDPGDDDAPTIDDVLRDLGEMGKAVTLILDDAETLDEAGLEAVRELTTLFHEGEALLQISLVGGTPLRRILYSADMEKIRQRIVASYHMPPMTPDEAKIYIRRRVSAVDGDADVLFGPGALDEVTAISEGVPGRIHAIANAAIRRAYSAGHDAVLREDVRDDVSVEIGEERTATDDHLADDTDSPVQPANELDLPSLEDVPVKAATGAGKAPAPKPYPISVNQLNAAIEQLQPANLSDAPKADTQKPAAPKPALKSSPKPALVKRPAKSPHELIMGKAPLKRVDPSSPAPVVAAAENKADTTDEIKEIPADIWDPVSLMDEAEAERLDAVSFPQNDDIGALLKATPAKAEVAMFLTDTLGTLNTLRETLKALREETEKMQVRREETREKLSVRIDTLREKLELARHEA